MISQYFYGMKKNLLYEAPKTELISVHFEENILSGINPGGDVDPAGDGGDD